MTEWTEYTSVSPTLSAEDKIGSKVISVLCDSIRGDTEDAIKNTMLSLMLNYHNNHNSWESTSKTPSCDVSITKTEINKHTVVNIIEQGPANSNTIVSSDCSVDHENSHFADDYEPDFIADTQSTKDPGIANSLRAPYSEKPEIKKAEIVATKCPTSADQGIAPPRSFKLSSAVVAPNLSKPKRYISNQDMVIPCQTGALRGPSGTRNVQRVRNPSQQKRNITTEVILLPSTRGTSEPSRQMIQQVEPVSHFPPRCISPNTSYLANKPIPLISENNNTQTVPHNQQQPDLHHLKKPQQQHNFIKDLEKHHKSKADEVESSLCDTPTYSNPMSFRKEVSQRQVSAPQKHSEQRDQEDTPTHGDVNPHVICLPTVHRYNSPQLLSSSRKPARSSHGLDGSSISSNGSCQPVNQSSPRLPQTDNLSLKEQNEQPTEKKQKIPKQKIHTDTNNIDPGEIWPRYDANYANYLKYMGKGMGPWDGNLDTTWDLSTIDYSLYDDEPGQLPINTANPKYIYTGLPAHPQGYTIPPGPPPVQGYEYEEGECLPSGALVDGYAAHYFKNGHYMGSGKASNNYQAINSDGVTYDYNNPQQRYLNGIMYRQQYKDYITNNPYSQSAINCGRNYYYQQHYHEQQLHDEAMHEQHNQYLYSVQQHTQSSEAIIPASYQQIYQIGCSDE